VELQFGIIQSHMAVLMTGFVLTGASSLVALAVGLPFGLLVCAGELSSIAPLRRFAQGYVWVLRTIPEALLVFWIYFCSPFLLTFPLDGFWAGSVAIGAVAAAYFAEIFRAGIASVPKGQREAGEALGLSRLVIWTHIVTPQALRVVLPPAVNYLSELIKNTTILATIGVGELAFQAYKLGAETFRYFEFLSAIAVAYFVVIFSIATLSRLLETRLRLA
jgi:His/Glu/Gln/Arg/opine family amino acid ABC transporter permease subunit